VAFLPGNNSVYRREVVLGLGADLPILLEAEPLLNVRLRERGHSLGIEPDAQILHAGEQTLLEFVEASYVYSRLLGSYRARIEHWSPKRIVVWVFLMPLIPFVRQFRLLTHTVTRRPEWLGTIARGMGYLLASSFAAALGQAVGLVLGAGKSREQFLLLEMNAPRDNVLE
jgi:hypothetical protein